MSDKSKGRSICRCVGKITVNPRLDEVKIVVVGKASFTHGILFHETTLLGKKEFEWNFLQKEYEENEGSSPRCTRRGRSHEA